MPCAILKKKALLNESPLSEEKLAAWNIAANPPNPTANPIIAAPDIPPISAAAIEPDENSKNDIITALIVGLNTVKNSHTVFQNTIDAHTVIQQKADFFIASVKAAV